MTTDKRERVTTTDRDAQGRRDRYPKGMTQPAEGFRFAVDALLLACYPSLSRVNRFLDLGTGCGVVGLGLLLRGGGQSMTGIGVDLSKAMVEAARENVRLLGMEERFLICREDVGSVRNCPEVEPESFDLVVANPPYRMQGRGRLSPGEDKRLARFEDQGGLDGFMAAGGYALRGRGRLALVYLSERLADLFEVLRANRLEPKRMRLVSGHSVALPRLVLVEAVKNGGAGLTVEPTLVIHADRQGHTVTDEAAEFCRFLR